MTPLEINKKIIGIKWKEFIDAFEADGNKFDINNFGNYPLTTSKDV